MEAQLESRIQELEGKLREMRRTADDAPKTDYEAEIAALEAILSKIGPFPLAPVHLRTHVGVGSKGSKFLNQGYKSAQKVVQVFGDRPSAPILDWGCGSGRTLWWLLLRHPHWRDVYNGTDVDAEAIEWLKSVGQPSVTVCSDVEISIPYKDNTFAGIFSFSVLTHIHPTAFRAWFSELNRVMAPGAKAYLTFNGDTILESDHPVHRQEAEVFKVQGWGWLQQTGHYKSAAFASHDYVASQCEGLFQVEAISRRDYATMDAAILTKE